MISLVHAALAATLCAAPPVAPGGSARVGAAPSAIPAAIPAAIPDTTYRRLFEGGVTMDAFLAKARARKEQWAANYARGAVADAVLTRARSAPGPWKLLVVAVDGCSDSVNTVPYIARLAEQVMGLEMRIVDNGVGRLVMDAHRTPDGRAATPTVILLDASYQERGCWIERPNELRDWILANRETLGDNAIVSRKMQWYDDDKGSRTLLDIAAMIEAAGKGEVKC